MEKRHIREFFVPMVGDATIELSSGTQIRDVVSGPDNTGVYFFAEVYEDRRTVWRHFKLFRTRVDLPEHATYLGSAPLLDGFGIGEVFHLYELPWRGNG